MRMGLWFVWRAGSAGRSNCPAGAGLLVGLETYERLPGADRVAVLHQPLDDRRGEGRGDRVAAAAYLYLAELRADADLGAGGHGSARAERAGSRGDEQPPVRRVRVGVPVRVLGEQRAGRAEV